jgi:hypothetical protein
MVLRGLDNITELLPRENTYQLPLDYNIVSFSPENIVNRLSESFVNNSSNYNIPTYLKWVTLDVDEQLSFSQYTGLVEVELYVNVESDLIQVSISYI